MDGATQGGFELRQAAAGSLLHLDRVFVSMDTGAFSWNSLLPGKLGVQLLGQVPPHAFGAQMRFNETSHAYMQLLCVWQA